MNVDSNELVPPLSNSCALAIMAKAPLAGVVKTRLVPPLTPYEAASLSACFLRDTARNVVEVGAARAADGAVMYTPATARTTIKKLLPEGFKLLAQRGESLGDRLLNGARDLLARGYQSVCLINSDSPTLAPSILIAAIDALAVPGDRVVLGEADDGGYYLIGLKSAHENLFERIAWSTADVLAHTIERARQIGLEVVLLPPWYDVDDAQTLSRLCSELFLSKEFAIRDNSNHGFAAPFTREFLTQFLQTDGRERIWLKPATADEPR